MGFLESAGNVYLYYKIAGMYIISIIFIIIGFVIRNIAKNDKHSKETTMSLSNVSCDPRNCNAIGNYSVNGSSYDIPVQYQIKDNSKHNVVYYDPNNPSDGTANKIPSWAGVIFMGIGSLVLLLAIGFTIFAMNSDSSTRATAGGVLFGMNAVSSFSSHNSSY